MEKVRICDVSPRDGLQNEKIAPVSTADKCALIEQLAGAGVNSIEVTSFVKPSAVPMMADADEVMRFASEQFPALNSIGLIFNEQGYERALAAGAKSVALVLVVSDSLSKANTGKLSDDWLKVYQTLIPRIRANGTWLRVYLAAAWICPYEGQIPLERTLRYADAVWELGVDELCPTDVIGQAHPAQVGALFDTFSQRYDMAKMAVHLHDTQALGLANAYAALNAGVRIFDTSLGGLGGCPFAPGSAGNLATEDFVLMAQKLGYDTGIDLAKLWESVRWLETRMGRPLGGRSRAWMETQPTMIAQP